MEAATPLRHPHVRLVGDRSLAIDGLVIDDEVAVRLVRERERNGEDAVKVVGDALEIGARVLDREQAAANAEYVKTEFERAARQLDKEFTDKARTVAEHFGSKVDEVFGPETGRLARELDKLFSDGSSSAVQHRVRELVTESLTKSREDLVRQFSAADGSNPRAEFKAGTIRALRQADERQHQTQQALLERLGGLERQLQGLREEKEKLEAVEAERERGTAKGRTFEENVAEVLDEVALAQGDVAEAVGDVRGATGKTGDVVVAIDACNGPARGRIVFEAKDRRLSKPRALAELDKAMAERDADFAVLVVPGEAEVPAKLQPLREYNGDKLIAEYDPADGSRLSLEVAYRLARARVLMSRGGEGGVDPSVVHDLVERALAAMDDVRKVKSQLTGAKTNIDRAYEVVEEMAGRVRGHLAEVDALVLGPSDEQLAAASDDQLEL
jgi:archaellum component FlaC